METQALPLHQVPAQGERSISWLYSRPASPRHCSPPSSPFGWRMLAACLASSSREFPVSLSSSNSQSMLSVQLLSLVREQRREQDHACSLPGMPYPHYRPFCGLFNTRNCDLASFTQTAPLFPLNYWSCHLSWRACSAVAILLHYSRSLCVLSVNPITTSLLKNN